MQFDEAFVSLLESVPDATVVVDAAGLIVLVNAHTEKLFGNSREELVGRSVETLISERYRVAYAERQKGWFSKLENGRSDAEFELCALLQDGRELPVEISITRFKTEDGIFVSAAVRDATEQKHVDQLRLRAELVDLVPDAVIVRGPADGRVTFWSRRARETYGYDPEETLGRVVHELLATEFTESKDLVDAALLRDGHWEGELHQIRKDGERITASSRQALQRSADGEPIAVIELNSDATEHRRNEDANRRLAAIVEHTRDAIVGENPDGLITDWNHGAERLYGYTAEEAIGQTVRMLMAPERAVAEQEILAVGFRGEGVDQYETVRIRKDGSRVPVSLTLSPIRDASGAVVVAATIARDISERKRFEGQLAYLADHDSLTGLFNRRRFHEELARELARVHRDRTGGALLAIDLDHFKDVNDSLGHSMGDQLLTQAGDICRRRLRATDVIARLGGDEFAVMLRNVSGRDARVTAAGLLDAIRRECKVDWPDKGNRITASIGIAPFDAVEDVTVEELLMEADIAMYDAKEAGRNRCSTYTTSEGRQRRMRARLGWTDRIRNALAEDRFVLHAQPILPLQANGAARHELLLRMVDEHGELIPPGVFLYIAERIGLIGEIDRWVLRDAIGLLAREQQTGTDIRLEVNLSGISITDDDLPGVIADELAAAGADAHGLCIEVTETAAIVNVQQAKSFAAQLSELGCEFALDDFGAGFASFYYLKHLAFDYLKIDGEFIQNMIEDPTDRLVVQSLVNIASGLNKATIAEFVGDRETLELLRSYGVDYAQGFHVGKPKPLAETDLARTPAMLE